MVMKYWDNWITAINCMNVSQNPTPLHVKYEGYSGYDTELIPPGGSKQIAVWIDPILPPSDYRGSAIITANTGSSIACMVGSSKGDPKPGDWTTQYNGIPMTLYP